MTDFDWDASWYAEITKTRWGYRAHFTNGIMETPYYHPFRFTRRGITKKSTRWIKQRNEEESPQNILFTIREK